MEFFQKIYKLFSYSSVESTNSTIRLLYQPGQVLPIVLADEQTAGRGTYGKNWSSPKGNLSMSFVIEQSFNSIQSRQLALLTGLAIQQILKTSYPDGKFLCKWPNDILLNNKKIAGILIEKAFYDDQEYFIIGIGLNIHHSYPFSTFPSTSLKEENFFQSNDSHFSQWLAEKIIGHLSTLYTQWMQEGFGHWQQIWNKCCYGWGKKVKSIEELSVQGIFDGIDQDGTLRIQCPTGMQFLASGTMQYDD